MSLKMVTIASYNKRSYKVTSRDTPYKNTSLICEVQLYVIIGQKVLDSLVRNY